MEELSLFWLQMNAAPGLVWWLAMLMAAIAAYMLHTYIDDYLVAGISSVGMFYAVLAGHAAFINLGVYFTSDKESNIAASAGVAICAAVLIGILLVRVWHAAYLLRARVDKPVE